MRKAQKFNSEKIKAARKAYEERLRNSVNEYACTAAARRLRNLHIAPDNYEARRRALRQMATECHILYGGTIENNEKMLKRKTGWRLL